MPSMTKWEYEKLDLNNLPRSESEIDVLNLAGANGWELVTINSCNVAIMKRAVPVAKAPRATASATAAARSK